MKNIKYRRLSHGLSIITVVLVCMTPLESCKQTVGNNTYVHVHCDWKRGEKALAVTIESPLIPDDLDLVLHMEGVFVHEGADTKYPFCQVKNVVTEGTDTLNIQAEGYFNGREDWPFELELMVTKKPNRVILEGKFMEFPESFQVCAMCPCLRGSVFSTTELHPFEMARKSFFYREGGFTWVSDANRGRAEGAESGKEGPWIQIFKTASFAHDVASPHIPADHLPWHLASADDLSSTNLVGWVSYDGKYMIGLASDDAYQVGTRWAPCLHSDPRMIKTSGESLLEFRSVVYVLSPEPDLLLDLYHEDFGEELTEEKYSHRNTLWPAGQGRLLDGMDNKEFGWTASHGSLETYISKEGSFWVNQHSQPVEHPEGIMEGSGSMLWNIPASFETTSLSRILKASQCGPDPLSYLSLDAINRGSKTAHLKLSVLQEDKEIGSGNYPLKQMTNRRILLDIRAHQPGTDLRIEISLDADDIPARIVIDNLRGYTNVDE